MFLTIKRKTLLISLGCLCIITSFFILVNYKTEYVSGITSPTKYTVVIDAGHGGIDGGSVGKTTGVKESDLNLLYAQKLAKYLKDAGIGVVMTRNDNEGLYDTSKKNLKKSDMEKRKNIIENSNANCVVSIHMNSFKLSSSKGSQTFYQKNNESGKYLADCIQKQFINALPNAKKTTTWGDYFMVNCTSLPSVIVECGFLSNPQEEKLLVSDEYQNKVCYSIMCGILNFLNESP